MQHAMYPAADLKTCRRLERDWRAAVRLEEACDDLAKSWRLAAASDRAMARLQAARDGVVLAAPRTRRNMALGAFQALAMVGRSVARAMARAASLRKAQAGAALWGAARAAAKVARKAVRRVVSAIVSAVMAPAAAGQVDAVVFTGTGRLDATPAVELLAAFRTAPVARRELAAIEVAS